VSVALVALNSRSLSAPLTTMAMLIGVVQVALMLSKLGAVGSCLITQLGFNNPESTKKLPGPAATGPQQLKPKSSVWDSAARNAVHPVSSLRFGVSMVMLCFTRPARTNPVFFARDPPSTKPQKAAG